MARDGKHFFMCVLAIWISSFEKVLLSSVVHFFIGSLILEEFSFLNSLYILIISPLLAKIFFYSADGLFNLETISFVVQKLFNFT
jgi:type IV secretory pathway TrbL component